MSTTTRTLAFLSASLLAAAASAQEPRKVSDAWTIEAITSNARLAADWMTANPKKHKPLDWTYGAFYAGVTALGLSDPALPYLDLIRQARDTFPDLPLAAYNVSGEYSMLKAAARLGWLDEKRVALECLTAIKRAGADMIITYFAKEFARSVGR